MREKSHSLGDEILSVYKRARFEGHPEVAEHLLRALEAMANKDGDSDIVEEAYLQIARRPSDGRKH